MIQASSLIALGQAAELMTRTPLYIIIVYMLALFALGIGVQPDVSRVQQGFLRREPIDRAVHAF